MFYAPAFYTYTFLILYYIYNELSVTYFHFLQEIKSNQTWKSLGNQKGQQLTMSIVLLCTMYIQFLTGL